MKSVLLALLLMLQLLFPSEASDCARRALYVWGHDVVPSLFPYMILCQSLLSELKQFPLLSSFIGPILGLLGGSPSSSASLALTFPKSGRKKRTCYALCTLSGTISPMFFLGPVSVWLHSQHDGIQLLLAHFIGACCASFFVYCLHSHETNRFQPQDDPVSASTSVLERSISSILNVGGCIVLFSVLANAVKILFPFLPPFVSTMIHSIFEISGGLQSLASCTLPKNIKMILCAALSGFGGFSLILQNQLFLRKLEIGISHLIAFSLIRAFFCAIIMGLLL